MDSLFHPTNRCEHLFMYFYLFLAFHFQIMLMLITSSFYECINNYYGTSQRLKINSYRRHMKEQNVTHAMLSRCKDALTIRFGAIGKYEIFGLLCFFVY